jgi:hypothetical protein
MGERPFSNIAYELETSNLLHEVWERGIFRKLACHTSRKPAEWRCTKSMGARPLQLHSILFGT